MHVINYIKTVIFVVVMPRDKFLTDLMHSSLIEEFDKRIKEYGRSYPMSYIYYKTVHSQAPSYFITAEQARIIISAFQNGDTIARKKELTEERDRNFYDTFNSITAKFPHMKKHAVIDLAIEHPAPRYYVNPRVAAIIIARCR